MNSVAIKKNKRTKLTIFTKYVSSLSADDYLDWLRARGKAYQLWPDSEFGWAIFDQWSSQAYNYKGEHETRELFFNFSTRNVQAKRGPVSDRKTVSSKEIKTFLRKCEPADDSHPYLRKKKIKGSNCYSFKGLVIIPLQDVSGEYVSLQTIAANGEKRFLKGTSTRGAYYQEKGND